MVARLTWLSMHALKQLRTFWYVAYNISHEESVQKLGVVNVVYNVGGFPKHGMDYEKSRRLARLFRAIPVRFDSFYVCLDEGAWVTVVETFAVSTLQRLLGLFQILHCR